MNHVKIKILVSSVSLMGLAACSSGSSKTPAAPANPYSAACSDLAGCVTVSNGFQFPDGAGGVISCVSGTCSDKNANVTDPASETQAGYNQGLSDGTSVAQQSAYNNGYAAGSASNTSGSYNSGYAAGNNPTNAYNSGYAAGQSTGYNQGVSDGQTNGYNSGYSDGSSTGYNSGYSAGSSDGYNDGYNSGYSSGSNDGYSSGYNDGYSSGYSDGSSGLSVIGSTKDTDLQKAQAQQMSLEARANSIAQQMGMSVDKATQMVQLTDQVKQMAQSGQMTQADRMAIANSALKIAGVSETEVNTAIASAMKGDMSSANDLMDKAAKNLGMNSGADVRDKLIPSVGLVMP